VSTRKATVRLAVYTQYFGTCRLILRRFSVRLQSAVAVVYTLFNFWPTIKLK